MAKYRSVRTNVDGIIFASKKEANRYVLLKALQKAGKIKDLTLQPRYKLEVNGKLICTYVADFRYIDDSGSVIVEDVKGVKTPVYRIKRKLMLAIHNVEIKEV